MIVRRLGRVRYEPTWQAMRAFTEARRLGLVKDRLRLKDATHIIANIAVPSTIRLVAETRDQLLDALRPFAAPRVAEEEQRAEAIRLGTQDVKDEERLLQRVTHLQTLVAWTEQWRTHPGAERSTTPEWTTLAEALRLAHKIATMLPASPITCGMA